MDNLKQQLKEYAHSLGFEKFGVAPIDRFAEARPGEHPEEILPGAKSVIVMCIRLLDGALSSTFRRFEDDMKDVHGVYGTYGYTMAPTFHQAMGIYALAQKIETETGAIACPMFTGGPLVNGASFSLRHAAYAAGLGQFGWNGIILTPEFGPRNRFSAIITTLELEPDPVYNGPELCDPTKCQVCVEACPTHAIKPYLSGDVKTIHCGGNTVEYNNLNYWRCQVAAHMLTKATGGDVDYVSDDPTLEEVTNCMKEKPIETVGLQGNPTWKCGACMIHCPVGNYKERFYDTGLTKQKH